MLTDREYNEFVLEKLQFGLEHYIAENVLDGSVEIVQDDILNCIKVRVRGIMWSEKVDVIEFKKPSTWWEMLKEEHAPGWFRHRWPVRYDTRTIDVRIAYPDFRPLLPDEQYRWMIMGV